jgi:protein SCO1/2
MRPWLRGVGALIAFTLLLPFAAWAQMNWHGEYFPNVTLTTQDGRKVRFYDDLLKDKVVAVSFIYTSCADVCPLDTAKLRQVQKLLGDRVGKDVFLYSITVDPKHDTPAVLKRYMEEFDVGPGWTFLTGRPQDITLIQRKFGGVPVGPGQLNDHDTRFIFGNEATGQWIKRAADEQPLVLANLLSGYLQKARYAGAAGPSYASVGRIGEASPVERLFRSRCASCHTIGGGDGLGPDLAGVTSRRSRAWVAGWIKEPDRMIRSKDPAAAALVKRFRGLQMPDLGLSDTDVFSLMGYLDTTNSGPRKAPPSPSTR